MRALLHELIQVILIPNTLLKDSLPLIEAWEDARPQPAKCSTRDGRLVIGCGWGVAGSRGAGVGRIGRAVKKQGLNIAGGVGGSDEETGDIMLGRVLLIQGIKERLVGLVALYRALKMHGEVVGASICEAIDELLFALSHGVVDLPAALDTESQEHALLERLPANVRQVAAQFLNAVLDQLDVVQGVGDHGSQAGSELFKVDVALEFAVLVSKAAAQKYATGEVVAQQEIGSGSPSEAWNMAENVVVDSARGGIGVGRERHRRAKNGLTWPAASNRGRGLA
ncbi:hypothetical protein CCHR01_12987 [Colletotrichum chrysophilum]|uniref:Uncharacterized protein n=1 Tax=Colletotrichum chrysophilum TaxID=1836956 RepID=A0AAD9AB12_9PEZI|nr:hypothetical protein CCHR01_12987 [Colletotrichum chrysophilum]